VADLPMIPWPICRNYASRPARPEYSVAYQPEHGHRGTRNLRWVPTGADRPASGAAL